MQDVEAGIIPPPGLSESNANPWKRATKRIMQEIAENATNPNKEIDEAWRTGKISKRQAKNLKATVRKLQGEFIEAWAAGEDMELFTRRVQAKEGDGMNDMPVWWGAK